jgi:hypothetical protein
MGSYPFTLNMDAELTSGTSVNLYLTNTAMRHGHCLENIKPHTVKRIFAPKKWKFQEDGRGVS